MTSPLFFPIDRYRRYHIERGVVRTAGQWSSEVLEYFGVANGIFEEARPRQLFANYQLPGSVGERREGSERRRAWYVGIAQFDIGDCIADER